MKPFRSSLRNTVLALTLLLLGGAREAHAATTSPAHPSGLHVIAQACQNNSAPKQRSAATAFQWNNQAYVIAGIFDYPEARKDEVCFSLENGAGALQLIARDGRVGLTLFTASSSTRLEPISLATGTPGDPYDKGNVDGFETRTNSSSSMRHFFPSTWRLTEIEIATPVAWEKIFNTGRDFSASGYRGILSEESLVILPGQPAKVMRERDLRWAQALPPQILRLGFNNRNINDWMTEVTAADWKPQLTPNSTLELKPGAPTTLWDWNEGASILETCRVLGATDDDSDKYPVGGLDSGGNSRLPRPTGGLKGLTPPPRNLNPLLPTIEQNPMLPKNPTTLEPLKNGGGVEPYGVGGLEDLLSDCRLQLKSGAGTPTEALAKRFVRDLGAHPGLRVSLAYRKKEQGFEIKSLANVKAFLQIWKDPSYQFLTDVTPEASTPLQEAAKKTQQLAVEFFRTQGGNPTTLREAFLLATLLTQGRTELVSADALKAFIQKLDDNLPLSLGNSLERVPPEQTQFAKAKKILLDSFLALEHERESQP